MRGADVNALLANIEPLLRYSAGSGVKIALDLVPDLPRCLLDPTQFDAAILNLVVNARDAMINGGEVRITTAQVSVQDLAYVRVRVQDSGKGMPKEVLDQVFDRFFTTKGEKGTGLGLAQVHGLMRQIGGQVSVSSKVGTGTTFDLFFPTSK